MSLKGDQLEILMGVFSVFHVFQAQSIFVLVDDLYIGDIFVRN